MSKLRVHAFSMSIDGYGAGPVQAQDDPLGRGGLALHEWIFGTRTFQKMYGDGAGEAGVDDEFVARGLYDALEQARRAAGNQDVRLGGGVSTIRQYLQERLVDELHIAITPVLLGSGEHLMGGIDLPSLGYACAEFVPSNKATHVVLGRRR